jgi:photosystem II stability/assembly factor-like uncharacterized protein
MRNLKMSQLKGQWIKHDTTSIAVEDGNLTVKLQANNGLGQSAEGICIPESGVDTRLISDGAIASNQLQDAFVATDGSSAITHDQDAGGFQVTDNSHPVSEHELATKYYVDSELQGLDFQQDILGIQTDALFEPVLVAGVRYLVTQVNALHASFGIIATVENNDLVEYDGVQWFVSYDVSQQQEGAICWNRESQYFMVYNGSQWIQFGGLNQVVVGAGLTATDNDLAMSVDNASITVVEDQVKLNPQGITKAHLVSSSVGHGLTGLDGESLAVVTGNGLAADESVHLDPLDANWEVNKQTLSAIKAPSADKQLINARALKESLLFHCSEQIMLTADMIAEKAIELQYAPDHDARSATDISVHAGPMLNHGHHFLIQGQQVSWAGKAPENILSEGDIVIVSYFVDRVHHAIAVCWNVRSLQRIGTSTRIMELYALKNGSILIGNNTNGQVWQTTNYGETFSLVQRLGSETAVYSFLELADGSILAGSSPYGRVWRSNNQGVTYELVQRLGSEERVCSLVQLESGVILAGGYPSGWVWRSTDNGATFSAVQRLGVNTYTVDAIIQLKNGVVLAGNGRGEVYKSVDDGESFVRIQKLGLASTVTTLLELDDGSVLAGTYDKGELYKSKDQGQSFQLVQKIGSASYISSLIQLKQGLIFVGVFPTGEIWQSNDQGESFTLVQTLDGQEQEVSALVQIGSRLSVLAGSAPLGKLWSVDLA